MTDIAEMTLEEIAERIRSSTPHAYLRAHKSNAGWTAWRGEIGTVDGIAGHGRTLVEALRDLLAKIGVDAEEAGDRWRLDAEPSERLRRGPEHPASMYEAALRTREIKIK